MESVGLQERVSQPMSVILCVPLKRRREGAILSALPQIYLVGSPFWDKIEKNARGGLVEGGMSRGLLFFTAKLRESWETGPFLVFCVTANFWTEICRLL